MNERAIREELNPVREIGSKPQPFTVRQLAKFILPSTLGVLFLMVPFKIDGHSMVMVSALQRKLHASLSEILDIHYLVLFAIAMSVVCTVIYRIHQPAWLERHHEVQEVVDVSIYWLIIRISGLIMGLAVLFGPKLPFIPEIVYSDQTGGLILYDLLSNLFVVFIVAGFVLPLLINFGILQFFGVILTKIMRSIFKLPGSAAVDCIASWIGDSAIGVALTGKQYIHGHYTEREAAVVATTFSVVSITYCIVVLTNVNMMDHFGVFYITIAIAGLVCAFVLPRIPPLSLKTDTYCIEHPKAVDEDVPDGFRRLQWATHVAVKQAHSHGGPFEYLERAAVTMVDLWFAILPTAMSVATIILIIDASTPLFKLLGLPFEPFLHLMQVPMAQDAAHSMVIGFADVIVPSIMASELADPMTQFIIAAISVVQLIYMTETGADLLGSNIPVHFVDLIIIFLERTIVSLPIIVLIAHFIF